MSGYIYCLTNSTIPGLVKIGKTSRDPQTRAAEISASTGVASPFNIEWSRKVRDMDKAESDLHKALDKSRLTKRREFFRCTPAKALAAAKRLQSFSDTKAVRTASGKSRAHKSRRDMFFGFTLTATTTGIFAAAVVADLEPSTVSTAIAGTGLALTVIFQSAQIFSALRR